MIVSKIQKDGFVIFIGLFLNKKQSGTRQRIPKEALRIETKKEPSVVNAHRRFFFGALAEINPQLYWGKKKDFSK